MGLRLTLPPGVSAGAGVSCVSLSMYGWCVVSLCGRGVVVWCAWGSVPVRMRGWTGACAGVSRLLVWVLAVRWCWCGRGCAPGVFRGAGFASKKRRSRPRVRGRHDGLGLGG